MSIMTKLYTSFMGIEIGFIKEQENASESKG